MNECPICFETITKNNKTILNCNHIFCIECINKIINDNINTLNCHICREHITEYKNNNILIKLIKKVNIIYNINITNSVINKLKQKYIKIIIKNNLMWIFLLFNIYFLKFYYIDIEIDNCNKI
jgi:hypothetical protein